MLDHAVKAFCRSATLVIHYRKGFQLEIIRSTTCTEDSSAVSELIGSCGGLLEECLDSAECCALEIQGSMNLEMRYFRVRATGW